MGSFTFVSYTGEDAGSVLVNMLADDSDGPQVVEIETETHRRIGFMPNDPLPEEDDEDDDEDDEEGEDDE